jgi:translation elongation factor EF-4
MEIFNQRLETEFSQQVITTFPGVAYQCRIVGKDNIKDYGSELLTISDPLKWPDTNIIRETYEPIVNGQILTPTQFAPIIKLICDERRGVLLEEYCIDEKRTLLKYKLPLAEIVYDFFDQLKQITSGYGTFDYEDSDYEKSNIVKMRICINNEEIDELSVLCHAKRAQTIGKEVVIKLKENIDRQQYAIKLEAKVHSTVLAKQGIPAYKKDVGAKLYGGDKTRLMKLLKRQEEGKERMRSIANIQVPRDAIIAVLKRK